MPFYFRKECPLNSGYLIVHMISFPLMGLTPPLFDLPWYENVSEIFGHLVWFWSIEIIRRDEVVNKNWPPR